MINAHKAVFFYSLFNNPVSVSVCVSLNYLVRGIDSGLIKVLLSICELRKASKPSVEMSDGPAEGRTERISIVRRGRARSLGKSSNIL
jgi:hypothetical protein